MKTAKDNASGKGNKASKQTKVKPDGLAVATRKARTDMSRLVLSTLLACFKIVAALYQAEFNSAKERASKAGQEFDESDFWADNERCNRILIVARTDESDETNKNGEPKTKKNWLKSQLIGMVAPLFRCGVRTMSLQVEAIKRLGVNASLVTVANVAKTFDEAFALVRNMSRCGLIANDKKEREVYFRIVVSFFAHETGLTGAIAAVFNKASGITMSEAQIKAGREEISNWLVKSRAATLNDTPQPQPITWDNGAAVARLRKVA